MFDLPWCFYNFSKIAMLCLIENWYITNQLPLQINLSHPWSFIRCLVLKLGKPLTEQINKSRKYDLLGFQGDKWQLLNSLYHFDSADPNARIIYCRSMISDSQVKCAENKVQTGSWMLGLPSKFYLTMTNFNSWDTRNSLDLHGLPIYMLLLWASFFSISSVDINKIKIIEKSCIARYIAVT